MVNHDVVTHRGRTVVYHGIPWYDHDMLTYDTVVPLHTMVYHGVLLTHPTELFSGGYISAF